MPEASGTENYVEENAGISEEETVAAKGPTASEEDEWLYSQPRRFREKNLPMSRKIDHMIVRYLNLD